MGVMVQLSSGKALRVVFALCLLALFAWMTWEAFLGYGKESPSAATFPRAILIPAIGLAAIAVFREITAKQSAGSLSADIAAAPVEVELELEEEIQLEPAVERKRTIIIIAWIVGFFIGIWLIGWMVTVPLAIVVFIKVAGRESWLVAIAAGVLGWVLFDGVFDARLNIPLSEKLDGILMSRLEDWLTSFRSPDPIAAELGLPNTNTVSINDALADSGAVVTRGFEWLFTQIPVLVVLGIAVVGFLSYHSNNAAKETMDRVAIQVWARVKRTS